MPQIRLIGDTFHEKRELEHCGAEDRIDGRIVDGHFLRRRKQAHEAVVSEADTLCSHAVDLGDNHVNQAPLPRRHGLEVARAAGLQDLLRQAVRVLANAVVTSLSVSVNVDDEAIPYETGVRGSRYGKVL